MFRKSVGKDRDVSKKLLGSRSLYVLKETWLPKHLTTYGKFQHTVRKVKKSILDIEVFNWIGLLIAFVLMFYMHWFKAMVLGVLGYIIYLRLELTLVKVFKR